MITNKVPATWSELQNMVANILHQCGFTVQVEKKIPTARGGVEVDVFALEDVNGRRYSIACECKYWKSAVPQSVIHGFRTVINDLGCNLGYIITTSDFQSGALSATQNTNVELLTWHKFQLLFLQSWYLNFFRKQAEEQLKFPNDWQWVYSITSYGEQEAALFLNIRDNINWIDKLRFSLPFDQSGNYLKEIIPSLPLNTTYLSERFFSKEWLNNDDTSEIAQNKDIETRHRIFEQTTFQELLDQMIIYGDEFRAQLQALRSKCEKPL